MSQKALPGLEECCYRTRGERLAYLRNRTGLTIGAAAELTGISSSELSRIENDRRKLTRRHVVKLSGAYGIEPRVLDEILGFKPGTKLVTYVHAQESLSHADRVATEVPLYLSGLVTGIGLSAGHSDTIALPEKNEVGPLSYAVHLTEGEAGRFFQPETLIIVDPGQRVVIGDLVVNTSTWSPLLVSLARNTNGRLVGRSLGDNPVFPSSTLLSSFHKVVAILPP